MLNPLEEAATIYFSLSALSSNLFPIWGDTNERVIQKVDGVDSLISGQPAFTKCHTFGESNPSET